MAELLLELLSEEIPARMQDRAAEDLKALVLKGLHDFGIPPSGTAKAFATPRRLALVVDGIPKAQDDRTWEQRGPRVGAPELAINKFKQNFLDHYESRQFEQRITEKG